MRAFLPAPLFCIAFLAGCDNVFGPDDDAERTIHVSHTGIVLAPGESMQLMVIHDPRDETVPREELSGDRWWSDDESVVRVDGDGRLEAVGLGRTTVWLEAKSERDSARVAVRDPEAEPTQRWRAVAVGEGHACALTDAGRAYCWGKDSFGELGGGTRAWITRTLAPARVVADHTFETITAGANHTCALAGDAEAWCWGMIGLTGSGVEENESIPGHYIRATPERVAMDAPVAQISSTFLHSCLLDENGTAYCWGNNFYGQLGLGHYERDTPPHPEPVDTDVRFSEIRPFELGTCALALDGAAYCWGNNDGGDAGNEGTAPAYATPQRVVGDHRFRSLARTGIFAAPCAITEGDATYCWGSLGYGLDHDDEDLVRAPAPLSDDPGFESVFAGGPGGANLVWCGLLEDGTALCWGWERHRGILGTEDVRDTCRDIPCNLTPVPVAGGHRFRDLSIGPEAACGVTTDGALYCWGRNDRAQLGTGGEEIEGTAIPVRVVDPV